MTAFYTVLKVLSLGVSKVFVPVARSASSLSLSSQRKEGKGKKTKMVISPTKTFFYTLDTIRFHEIIISFETSSNRLWFSRRFSLSYLKPFCDQNSIWGETLKVRLIWARHVEFGQGKIGIWGAFGRSCSNAIEWIKKKKNHFWRATKRASSLQSNSRMLKVTTPPCFILKSNFIMPIGVVSNLIAAKVELEMNKRRWF